LIEDYLEIYEEFKDFWVYEDGARNYQKLRSQKSWNLERKKLPNGFCKKFS